MNAWMIAAIVVVVVIGLAVLVGTPVPQVPRI